MQVLSEIKTNNLTVLTDMPAFSREVDAILERAEVQNLGKVEHSFEENHGFTLVVCLAESHVAVHTWPELNRLTLDVYLCNYIRDNTGKCEQIFQDILSYFDPVSDNTTRVQR